MSAVTITGRIIELGDMDEGRGLRIEKDGEDICITGLTEDEVRVFGRAYGDAVTVTVAASQPASTEPSGAEREAGLRNIAAFPLDDFGFERAPDNKVLWSANDWKLTVGDIRAARAALPVQAQPVASDEVLSDLIENAEGVRQYDGEYRLDGSDLMKLMRSAAALAPTAAPQPAAPVAQPVAIPEGWMEQARSIIQWMHDSVNVAQNGPDTCDYASEFDYNLSHAASTLNMMLDHIAAPSAPANQAGDDARDAARRQAADDQFRMPTDAQGNKVENGGWGAQPADGGGEQGK